MSEITKENNDNNYFEFEFDDVENIVSFETVEGNIVMIKSPKTKQMLDCRKLVKKFGDEFIAEDEDFIGRMVSLACVIKYGEKDSMSYSEYEELSIVDSAKMAKALEFFRAEFNQVQHLLKSLN